MKKTVLILFSGLLLLAAPLTKVMADASDSTTTSSSGWYIGMGMGIDAPALNWETDSTFFTLGGGGNLFTGYRINPSLSLQLSVSPLFFTGGGQSIMDARISPELKLSNPSPGWAAYILVGPGYDFQFASPSGYTTSSFAVVTGLGFQFDFHPGEHAFIEGRYDFLIYNNVTQQDIPVLVGLSEDL